jgi:hypothetical protein
MPIIFSQNFIKLDSLIKSNYFTYGYLFSHFDFTIELFIIIDQIFVLFASGNLGKFI